AAGARALHADLDAAHAEGLRRIARGDRRLCCRERSALARPLEADAAGARPGHDRPFRIGDGNDRVVERGLDVRKAVVHDALLAALLERLFLCRPSRLFLVSPFWWACSAQRSART